MVTTVGTGNDPKDVVAEFIQLERDVIAAYDSALERLSDAGASSKIKEFREDHLGHVRSLEDLARQIGAEVPSQTDSKAMLTKGKVAIAGVTGDNAILSAMSTNEDDTMTAYRNGCENDALPPEVKALMQRAYEDETRHRAWMANTEV